MFGKILIANRGEIALRIIRACKELKIKSVLVYSEADASSLPVMLADETVCIGPPPSNASYLNINRILAAAEICDVDSIHPGYGFLAENAEFAKICKNCNIKFIGPDYKQIELMENKVSAKKIVRDIDVPTIPGSIQAIKNEKDLKKIANEIGFPVIIKSAYGGGGRGMRIANNEASLVTNFYTTQMESKKAFGFSDIYLEKFIKNAKHIEVQILADQHDNVIHLGQRECSLQRRYQKIIEETPPVISINKQNEINEDAIKIAKCIKYDNIGTIEFVLDMDTNKHYFIEMNVRIQVEHPITEEVTKIDIVKQQIKSAYGEKLNIKQKDVKINGHAIECRINAEDPLNNFMPCVGNVKYFIPPGGPGIRIDSHFYSGYSVSPFYDSLICKLIVHDNDRKNAILKCKRALNEFYISDIKTTLPLLRHIISEKIFSTALYKTRSIDVILNQFTKNYNG